MAALKHATYIGPVVAWEGQTALLQETNEQYKVRVQFDDMAFHSLAHGWHVFPSSEWRIDRILGEEK